MSVQVTLEHIQRSSLKSAALEELASVAVSSKGLDGDRVAMVVRANGNFLSQRQNPTMGALRSHFDGAVLTLQHPAMTTPLNVNLEDVTQQAEPVVMFDRKKPISVIPVGGKECEAWLTEAIGKKGWNPLRLVVLDPAIERLTNPDFITEQTVAFRLTDAGPLSVHSTESEKALNEELKARSMPEIDRRRFRSNLVFSGFERPWAEMGDAPGILQQITDSGPGAAIKLIRAIPRCAVPRINPDTFSYDLGTDFATEVLPGMNQQAALSDDPEGQYLFGEYAVLDAQPGKAFRLSVGDRFVFQEHGATPPD